MELFKLAGSIYLNDKEVKKSLKNIDKKAGKAGKGLTKLGNMAKKSGKVMAVGLGVALGGAVALVDKVGDASSEIMKFSEVTGHSAEAYQEWDHVMKKYGYSMEQASGDLAALGEKAMDAANGVGEGAELFSELGVEVQDSSGKLKSQEKIFQETIQALQGMEDVTKRNAIASALLSTTGEELAPVLNMTAEELENMKDNANIFDEDSLEEGKKFNVMFDELKNKVGFLFQKLAIKLMPMITQFAEFIKSNLPQIKAVFKTVFEAIGNNINTGVKFIKGFIDFVSEWVEDNKGYLKEMKKTFSGMFENIKEIITTFIEIVKMIWNEYGEEIMAYLKIVWDNIVHIIDTAIKIVKDIFNIFAALFKGDWSALWESVKSLFSNIWNGIKGILGNFIDAIKVIISAFGKTVSNIWGGIWEGLKGTFENIWNGIKDFLKGIVDGIGDTIKGMVNIVIKPINWMIDQLNKLKFKVPSWVKYVGLSSIAGKEVGFNIPNIKLLAEGGLATNPALAIIGEGADDEAVLPLNDDVYGKLADGINSQSKNEETSNVFNFNISLDGATFRNRDDIDYLSEEMDKKFKRSMREVGMRGTSSLA